MHNYHCKTWLITDTYFRNFPFIMTNDKDVKMLSAKKLETVPLLLFPGSQLHHHQCVCFHFNLRRLGNKQSNIQFKHFKPIHLHYRTNNRLLNIGTTRNTFLMTYTLSSSLGRLCPSETNLSIMSEV